MEETHETESKISPLEKRAESKTVDVNEVDGASPMENDSSLEFVSEDSVIKVF